MVTILQRAHYNIIQILYPPCERALSTWSYFGNYLKRREMDSNQPIVELTKEYTIFYDHLKTLIL